MEVTQGIDAPSVVKLPGETDVLIKEAYILNDFVVADEDTIVTDDDLRSEISAVNIVVGPRKRNKPQRYVDANYTALMLEDVPSSEMNNIIVNMNDDSDSDDEFLDEDVEDDDDDDEGSPSQFIVEQDSSDDDSDMDVDSNGEQY